MNEKYDFFIAGRTRNREQILIFDKIFANEEELTIFLENEYMQTM